MAEFLRARTGFMRDPKTLLHRPTFLAFNRIETTDIPTAATDGPNLFVNVGWMEKWTKEEQIGVLVHECLHRMLKHHLRFKPASAKALAMYPGATHGSLMRVFNVAADIRINSDMIEDGFSLPKDVVFDKEGRFAGWPVERIFFKLLEEQDEREVPWGGFEEHPTELTREEEQEIDKLVTIGVAMCKRAGVNSASLKEMVKATQAHLDWKDILPEYLKRTLGSDDYTMQRLSKAGRRQGWIMPGMQSTQMGPVLLVIDTSGSISQRELGYAGGIINNMVQAENPEELKMMQCDAKVKRVDDIQPGEQIGSIEVAGRGGTSFVPPFKWIEEQGWEPDFVIYLTDGRGDFPKDPGIETVWLMTTDVVAPFGKTIRVHV